MKYKIIIEETIADEFELEANIIEEAIENATKNYKTSKFVLEPGCLEETKIKVIDEENNKESEWKII